MKRGSLRERTAQNDLDRVRTALETLLKETKESSREIHHSAVQIAATLRQIQRGYRERLIATLLIGIFLFLFVLVAMPLSRGLSDTERRRMQMGERMEHVWETLSPEEKEVIRRILQ